MRYFLGLAIGHKYGWCQVTAATHGNGPLQACALEEEEEPSTVPSEEREAGVSHGDLDDAASVNSMDRGLVSEESDDEANIAGTGGAEADEVESEDDELYTHYQMYEEE